VLTTRRRVALVVVGAAAVTLLWVTPIAASAIAYAGTPTAATAAAPDLTIPNFGTAAPAAYNALPSEVATWAGTGSEVADLTTVKMVQYLKSPGFWHAVLAVQNETQNAGQEALFLRNAGAYSSPLASTGAIAASDVLPVLGAGLLSFDLTSKGLQLFGYDASGEACAYDGGTGWASVIYGQTATSCQQMWATRAGGWLPNRDVASGVDITLGSHNIEGDAAQGEPFDHVDGHLTYTGYKFPCPFSDGEDPTSGHAVNVYDFGHGCLTFDSPTIDTHLLSQNVTAVDEQGNETSFRLAMYDGNGHHTALPITAEDFGQPSCIHDSDVGSCNVPDVGGKVDKNPSRRFRCRVTGSDGAVYESLSRAFDDDGLRSDTVMPVPDCGKKATGIPDTVMPTRVDVDEVGGPVDLPLINKPIGRPSQDTFTCSIGGCLLDLVHNGISCFTSGDCAGWFADVQKGDKTYACRFGGASVAMKECAVYRHSFDPKKDGTPAGAASSPNGVPIPSTNPTVWAEPDPNADPDSAPEPEWAPRQDPGEDPGWKEEPVNDPFPEAGTDPDPDPGEDPSMPPGNQSDPTKEPDCMSELWSNLLNPVAWVVTPVKCALSWAFKPNSGDMAQLGDDNAAAFDGSPLGTIRTLVLGSTKMAVQAAGCKGPPFTLALPHIGDVQSNGHNVTNGGGFTKTWYPMDACDDPMAGVALTVRAILTGVLAMLTGFACLRYAAGIIGYMGFGAAKADGGGVLLVDSKTGEIIE
jgi:hypothetical protein